MFYGVSPAEEIPDDFVRAMTERVAVGALIAERARFLIIEHRRVQPRAHVRDLFPELFAAAPPDWHRHIREFLEDYGCGLEPTRTDAGQAASFARARVWQSFETCRAGCDACVFRPDPELNRARLELRPAGFTDLRTAFRDAAVKRRPLSNPWADALDAIAHGQAKRGEVTFAWVRDFSRHLRTAYPRASAPEPRTQRGRVQAAGGAKWTPAGRILDRVAEVVRESSGDVRVAEYRLRDHLDPR